MTSTITTHNFGQMQHAEYESQVARYATSSMTTTMTTKKHKLSDILGMVSTLLNQVRVQFSQYRTGKVAVNA